MLINLYIPENTKVDTPGTYLDTKNVANIHGKFDSIEFSGWLFFINKNKTAVLDFYCI